MLIQNFKKIKFFHRHLQRNKIEDHRFGIFEQPMFYVLLLFLLCVYNYLFDVKVADFWKSLKLQNVQFWSGWVAVGLRWTRVDVGVGVCLVETPSVHVDAGLGRQSPFARISAKTSTWLSDQRVRFCWSSELRSSLFFSGFKIISTKLGLHDKMSAFSAMISHAKLKIKMLPANIRNTLILLTFSKVLHGRSFSY